MTEENFLHDFGDGALVSAHRHPNGGGIVADTASVELSCHIGPDVQVFENALVKNACRILDHVKIYGNATVKTGVLLQDTVEVSGGAEVTNFADIFGDCKITKTPITLTGFNHPVVITDTHIVLGCHSLAFSDWEQKGQAIMRTNGYPTELVRRLYEHINVLRELHADFYGLKKEKT